MTTTTPLPFVDPTGNTSSRMHKRRRLASTSTAAEDSNPPDRQLAGPDDDEPVSSHHAATDLDLAENAYAQHRQRCKAPTADNVAPNASSPYPDVSSFQQPYFHQHTDPSIYNSPWPPAADASSVPYATSSSYVTAPHGEGVNMPLFPPMTSSEVAIDASEGLDPFDNTFQNAFADLDVTREYQNTVSGAQPVSQPTDRRSKSSYQLEDAGMHLKIQSLPILDNLAVQVIQTVSKANYQTIQRLIQGMDTEEGQAYSTLKNLFDQTRKVYSRDTPFIDAVAIHMFQPAQQETIRRANIATFVSSLLGAHDVGFFQLNEYFLETFVSLSHRLLKWQGAMFLELKTQAYISALMNSDGTRESILDELFPADLDAQILSRHPDAASLSPSEQDFVDRSRARKSYLLAEPATDKSMKDLPKKYQWTDFVREFASCISKNAESILNLPPRVHVANPSSNTSHSRAHPSTSLGRANTPPFTQQNPPEGFQAALAEKVSSSSYGALLTSVKQGKTDQTNGLKKSLSSTTTVRQPWTKAEEDALLCGLEKVSGPHWSQILALYGRGGSVSEVLKDRNQVQLKDKARNLKLWHLKMGKDVPVALQGVTGELRKRGGARARAALNVKDDEDESGREPVNGRAM